MARTNVTVNTIYPNIFEKTELVALDDTLGGEIAWNGNDERMLIMVRNDHDTDREDDFAGDAEETTFTLSESPILSITSVSVDGSDLTNDSITDKFNGDGETTAFQLTHLPVEEITFVTVGGSAVFADDYEFDTETGVLELDTAPAEGEENVVVVYSGPVYVTDFENGTITFDTAPGAPVAPATTNIKVKYVDAGNRTLKILKGDSKQSVNKDLEVTLAPTEVWVGFIESGRYKQHYNTTADTEKRNKMLLTGGSDLKVLCIKGG